MPETVLKGGANQQGGVVCSGKVSRSPPPPEAAHVSSACGLFAALLWRDYAVSAR